MTRPEGCLKHGCREVRRSGLHPDGSRRALGWYRQVHWLHLKVHLINQPQQ